MPELNGESVIFIKVTPGYVEKSIGNLRNKPNITRAEPVFGRHDVALQGRFNSLMDLHAFQAGLLLDYVRGFQTYPAAKEFMKPTPNGSPVSAWLLIRASDPTRVASELKNIDGIESLIGTVGNFDLIAKFGAGSIDELMTTVLKKVNLISGVRATETLTAFPST